MKIDRLFKIFYINNTVEIDKYFNTKYMYIFYSPEREDMWLHCHYAKSGWSVCERWYKIEINVFPYMECIYDMRLKRCR